MKAFFEARVRRPGSPHRAIFRSLGWAGAAVLLLALSPVLPGSAAHAQCDLQMGCTGTFGVPQGVVAEINENFISDILYQVFNAYGLTSPRGDYFLTTGNLDGYVLTEPEALNAEHRRLPWAERLPGYFDELWNWDDDVYPEDDDNVQFGALNQYPLGDDSNILAAWNIFGGFHTFAAESCPEHPTGTFSDNGFFGGLSEAERDMVLSWDDATLEAELAALDGWPEPWRVNDVDMGIGPGAYELIRHFAMNLERTPHNEYNRYSFFKAGPNWFRVLPPIALIREDGTGPFLELRFPLVGVYNPLGCAAWYYEDPASRTFSESDIKVAWMSVSVRARLDLEMIAYEGTATEVPDPYTLVDATQSWQADELVGATIRITGGPGAGQAHEISGNTADTLNIFPSAWFDVDPPQPGSTYQIEMPRLRISFPDPNTEYGAFSMRWGNLFDGFDARIADLTVDPDWPGAAADWRSNMRMAFLWRQAFINALIPWALSQIVHEFLDDFFVPLDFLFDNIHYLDDTLLSAGLTYADLGLRSDFLSTLRFKMWELDDPGGAHENGLAAVAIDLMGEFVADDWEVAEEDFIPEGKQFAAVVSNEALNNIAGALFPSTTLERDPPDSHLWFDLPYTIDYPLEDPCSGDLGLLEYVTITDVALEVPSGSYGGIPQVTTFEGSLRVRVPWYLFLIAMGLVIVGLALIAIFGWWPWIHIFAWPLIAWGLALHAACIELANNDLNISLASGRTIAAEIEVHYEDSLPQLWVNLDIDSEDVEIENRFYVLTTILDPIVIGPLLSAGMTSILHTFWDGTNMPQKVFLTAFTLSMNFNEHVVSDWLGRMASNYEALTDGNDNTHPDPPDLTLEAFREQWRTNDAMRHLVTMLKLNRMTHYPRELLGAGVVCIPPDFYDLHAVHGSSCEHDRIMVDQCVNYYEDGLTLPDEQGDCQPYYPVCKLFTCTPDGPEICTTADDIVHHDIELYTLEERSIDDLSGDFIETIELTFDCDTELWDLLGSDFIGDLADVDEENWMMAQAQLCCEPYGSFVPEPDCEPNVAYCSRKDNLMDLRNAALGDADGDGLADGLSDSEYDELEGLVQEQVQESAEEIQEELNDPVLNYINEVWVNIRNRDCGGKPFAPWNPIDDFWPHPLPDDDLDDDGFPRHNCQAAPCDCEDLDPTIYPTAPELCDEKDNQCTFDAGHCLIDEGCAFRPLSPPTGSELTDPPVFAWTAGVLEPGHTYAYLLVLYVPYYGEYQLFPLWANCTSQDSGNWDPFWYLMDEDTQAAWAVGKVNITTSTLEEVRGPWFFRKVAP